MRIENVNESEFGTELVLSRWPTWDERELFEQWTEELDISQYIHLISFKPSSASMTNMILPAIHIHPRAPDFVKTMCLLRWT